MTCQWFELLSRIPFAGLRLRLCRRHVDGCPCCRQESESGDVLPAMLVTADRLPPGLDLWPGVKKGIEGARTPAPGSVPLAVRRTWRWATAAALLVLTLLAGFWALFLGRGMKPHPGPAAQRPAAQTRLCTAKIADRPARVFQVQSRNPDRTIFWIAKDDNRS